MPKIKMQDLKHVSEASNSDILLLDTERETVVISKEDLLKDIQQIKFASDGRMIVTLDGVSKAFKPEPAEVLVDKASEEMNVLDVPVEYSREEETIDLEPSIVSIDEQDPENLIINL